MGGEGRGYRKEKEGMREKSKRKNKEKMAEKRRNREGEI